ncbi:hypothetical protein K1T71_003424 [Dendrolimus kikuchii]|uniref:Uncharacterized protein n=1 Tax=Dendrolimus kikuchii TaxID=765133 RepID=A0ACC1DBJ7_9NEOP|nr:hypothetical protein K1T71_003424 [Dendrolimus kikuchii]
MYNFKIFKSTVYRSGTIPSLTTNYYGNNGPSKIMSCDGKQQDMSERQLLEHSCLSDAGTAVPMPSPDIPDHWKEFVCGGGSAFCNILISYPLNKLIFRQMMHGVETTFALNQLQKEGLTYLYRGMLPPLMQRSLSMSVMFGIYDECLQPLQRRKVNPYIAKTTAGVVAGCVEATLMPFERIQTLLIHPKYHLKFRNTAHAARHIARHYGIKEFYRGLTPILLRNGPSNAMFFIIRDEIKMRMPTHEKVFYQSIQNFLSGATIGAFLSTLYYPLNVIKIAMQFFSYFCCFYVVTSQRPQYREDYRYEKAFNTFYKLHHTPSVWADARVRCEAEGAELMVPGSLDEADAMPLLIADILNKYEGIFVGIHDLYSERNFDTISGKQILGSILNLLWEHQEPKYGGGRCVAMRRSGRLFVHPCGNNLPFICKISAKRIKYYQECSTYDPKWTLGPNGSCYLTHDEPQIWFTAYATCLSAGGHLAVINSRAEAQHIRSLFKNVTDKRMPITDMAFLGFNDLFQRHHYRTIHGQRLEDIGYTDWDLKCRVDEGNKMQLRCGGMWRSGLLTTSDCNIPATFFCEKLANSTKVIKLLRHNNNNMFEHRAFRDFNKNNYINKHYHNVESVQKITIPEEVNAKPTTLVLEDTF